VRVEGLSAAHELPFQKAAVRRQTQFDAVVLGEMLRGKRSKATREVAAW
jgi:hypothetical protein